MKKLIVLLFTTALFCCQDVFPKACDAWMFVAGDTVTSPYTNPYLIPSGQPINVLLYYALGGNGICGNCSVANTNSVTWIHHGDTTHNATYSATDTGWYNLTFRVGSCGLTYYLSAQIRYATATSVNDINVFPVNYISLYPSISRGIYKIKNDKENNLTKIEISDNRGKIVFSSTDNVSEINLSNFSDGIYFYAIEDKTNKIFSGKIIKQ